MITPIPLIAMVIAIFASLYASYSDLKGGIIPNKLTFPLIGVGLILNGINAVLTDNYLFFIVTIIITAVIFTLGYLFWKMGAWAGGDVKLFTALAALIPLYTPIVSFTILNIQFPIEATYPFPFTLIINSILSMLPFLLIYVIYISVKTKPYLLRELLSPVKEYKKNLVLALVITSAVTITLFITPFLPFQIILVSLILVYFLSLIISKFPNRLKAVLISVITVFALYQNLQQTLSAILIIIIVIILFEIIKKLLTKVNREALQDDYSINDLKEGMIPVYNLYQDEEKVFMDKKSFLDRMREAIKTGDISKINPPQGKLLISNMAAGLSDDDLELLKRLYNDSKIKDEFRIKRGVPFAPSIFIGLLISLFIGDLAIMFMNVLNWLL